MKRETAPRVFIYVEGGLIQSIIADRKVKLMVLDGDVEGGDDYEEYTDFHGAKFEAFLGRAEEAEISIPAVDHYFKERKRIWKKWKESEPK